MSEEKGTLDRVRALRDAARHEDVIALATAEWPRLARSQDLEAVGEIARYASLSCLASQRATEAVRWRSRALSCFARGRAMRGIALLLLAELFRLEPGSTQVALSLLHDMDELLRAAGPEGCIRDALVDGIIQEKRGYVLFAAGTDEDALAAYAAALPFVADDRRRDLKIRLAVELTRYVSAPDEAARLAARDATAGLTRRAQPFPDLARQAEANHALMAQGVVVPRERFTPYETV